ncbi:MAG: prolyl oligopeptidase family serine peptidase [Candidatus Thiodiazotropha endolucinida]
MWGKIGCRQFLRANQLRVYIDFKAAAMCLGGNLICLSQFRTTASVAQGPASNRSEVATQNESTEMSIEIRSFGSWDSTISACSLSVSEVRLGGVAIDGGDTYWLETRPNESGRTVLRKMNEAGDVSDILPPPYNARNLANSYGGGGVAIRNGVLWFCNLEDQRIYEVRPDGSITPKSPSGSYRYADLCLDHKRNRLLAVRESREEQSSNIINELVSIDLYEDEVSVVSAGHDFYSNPVISPDGNKIAWLTWNHPSMPWIGTQLWQAEFAEKGELINIELVAGDDEESLFQPCWSPSGILYVVSDRSGWWNLYKVEHSGLICVFPAELEFGKPLWKFGTKTYGFISETLIACIFCDRGLWKLSTLDVQSGYLKILEDKFTSFVDIKVASDRILFSAGAPNRALSIYQYDLNRYECKQIRLGVPIDLDEDSISIPEHIEFPTTDDEVAYGFYYAPRNCKFSAPRDELPPLIVFVHGGPTSSATAVLEPRIQYWTSRGFAILDVNYRGSTGYGTRYRHSLALNWGRKDVEDCVAGADYLASKGVVDEKRMAIRGFSAGGYTVLRALSLSSVFSAGTVYYGVSDIQQLGSVTHNFESRYLDWLVSPGMQEDCAASHESNINDIHCPLLFFHGEEDKVVPSMQTRNIVNVLTEQGTPVKAIYFETEGHGFRQASTIEFALNEEYAYYRRVLGVGE